MNVVIVGEKPFLADVSDLCSGAGRRTDAYPVADVYGAGRGEMILAKVARADVVIEMQNESAAAKQALLGRLADGLSKNVTVLSLALATSATQAAAWLPQPERLVGFGVVSPLGDRPTVEVAPALQSAESTLVAAEAFWKGVGVDAVRVADGPGLVRARLLCCLINEAASALMEGVATAEDIDLAMKLGTHYPYGPLEWADHLGLDIVLSVMTGLFEEWGDDRYRPTPLLRRMVLAGQLGQKTGRGFFDYSLAGVDNDTG